MTINANSKQSAHAAAPLPGILFVADESNEFAVVRNQLQKNKLRNPINLVGTVDEMFNYLHGEIPYQDRVRFSLPAVIIMDVSRPEVEGLRAQAMLRSSLKFRHIPIIVIGSARKGLALRTAVDLGADAFMVKPFSTEDFKGIVGKLRMPVEFAEE
jgi:CheY-like chemotaxis protein